MTDGGIGHIEDHRYHRYRKEEPRYSRRVSMDEIEKNDFNLNISRYVSTVPRKRSTAAVHTDLLVVEKQIGAAKERYNQYLAELGLPLLP
ncbi:hypothetical protein BANRA_05394 [Escherichia coli]|nr:N-6 DNA methylase [Escherichia coli]VCW49648.1 hypothetical protein BANRA_05394 [Escherichia coli]